MKQPDVVEQMRAALTTSREVDIVDRLRAGLKLESLAVGLSNPFLVDAASEAADEIERLREQVAALQASSGYEASIAQVEIDRLRAEVDKWLEDGLANMKRLQAEVDEWKDRFFAERKDHEATMKAWDEERSGL